MYKIVEDGEKFKIKEVDEHGNTVGLLEETFDSHNDATDFLKDLEEGGGSKKKTPKASDEDEDQGPQEEEAPKKKKK